MIYVRKKLTRCPNFTWFLPEKYFPEFWGGKCPPAPPRLLRLCRLIAHKNFSGVMRVTSDQAGRPNTQFNDATRTVSGFNPPTNSALIVISTLHLLIFVGRKQQLNCWPRSDRMNDSLPLHSDIENYLPSRRPQCRINYGSGGSPEPGPLNSGGLIISQK